MENKNDNLNIVKEFYHKLQLVDGDTKSVKRKLKAVCKKCSKTIACSWEPVRVTSNFVTHTKVRNLEFLLNVFWQICNY